MVIEEAVGGLGFFGRLKDAIGGVVVGLVMLLAAVGCLFWGEGRSVKRAKALESGNENAIEIKSDKVEAANEKKLVCTNGLATTDEVLKDVQFEVEAKALKLRRGVKMYQWEEKTKTEKRGKKRVKITYYEKGWSSNVINSSGFKEKVDPDTKVSHTNPSSMPFEGKTQQASLVTLGGFKLSSSQVGSISGWQALTPKAVPASMGGSSTSTSSDSGGSGGVEASGNTCPECGKVLKSAKGLQQHIKDTGHKASAGGSGSGGGGGGGKVKLTSTGFYIGASQSSPAIGDVQINFEQVPPSDVTVVAVQTGDTFEAYLPGTDNELDELKMGKLSKAEMFAALEADNAMLTWAIRIGGWLLCMIGFALIFKPFAVIADAVPLVGGIVSMGIGLAGAGLGTVVALMVVALGWVFYRPLVGIPLMLLSIGLFVGLIMMAKGKAKGGGAALEADGGAADAAPA